MRKILLFGNSGSGKSTRAKKLCQAGGLAHLDLDTLAWQASATPARKPLQDSAKDIAAFIQANGGWVIEGCYTDLLDIASPSANELIFMDLPVAACIANAKSRPWEPHKYPSKEAQDKNLSMLLDWIAQYPERSDTFSGLAHQQLYDRFSGKKSRVSRNE